MSALPQIRVRPQPLPGPETRSEENSTGQLGSGTELRIVPAPPDNTLQVLRDAIARLNSTTSEFGDQTELADLVAHAQGALERARLVAQCVSQCEDFLRQNQFEPAFQALDAGLLVYPTDPALSTRRRDAEARHKLFLAAAAVRAALDETQWLLDQARPDLAWQFLDKKVAELPEEPELKARLREIEAPLRQWEQHRLIRAALERALTLEERRQWPASLAVLDEALRQHPASTELLDAAQRVRDGQAEQERTKKLARRLELIRQKISERAWSPSLALLASAQKEFPEATELAPLRLEAERGLKRFECEAVVAEVRQHLADEELDLAEKALKKGFSSLGREPALEALRQELESEKEYRHGLRDAQVLFGRRQLEEAENILARLVVQDRPEAQALLETVRQTRTSSDEEKFFAQGRESALELIKSGQFEQAADVLRNLLSLFPGNVILARDLNTAEAALARTSASVPVAEAAGTAKTAAPVFAVPSFGRVAAEESSAGNHRGLFMGVAALAVVALSGAAWQFWPASSSVRTASARPQVPVAAQQPIAAPASTSAAASAVQQVPAQTSKQPPVKTQPPPSPAIKPAANAAPLTAQPEARNVVPAPPPKAVAAPDITPPPTPAPPTVERVASPPAAQDTAANVSAQSLSVPAPELVRLSSPPIPTPAASAVAATPTPPAPASPAPKPIGGRYEEAKLVSSILPIYPSVARQRGIFGLVRMEGSIDERGNVKSVKVLSGDPFLAAAASSVVARWKYKPAMLNGQPIAVKAQIQVSFDK